MVALFAETALLPETGWSKNVRIIIDEAGRITSVEAGSAPRPGDETLTKSVLLPAPANLHSHAFQRAMAGMTESRGPSATDSFWTWRTLMYRFLERLDPDQVEAIAALTYVEMLEAGYACVGEFHYLHHQPGGVGYVNPAELGTRIVAAAEETGIGLTLLPVLYAYGGADLRPLAGGQLRFGCDFDRFVTLFEHSQKAVSGLPGDAAIGIAPHSLRAVSRDMLKQSISLQGGPIHIHAAEQTAEVEEITAYFGAPPIRWLLDNAAIDGRWCTIHSTHMTADETRDLARSGAVAGLCPITEANLGDGIFNGKAFLDAGGAFGVGSDSNIRIALTEELRTFEYTQRYRDRARAVLASPSASAGRRLYDVSVAGSMQAMNRASGKIASGAWADLVAVDGEALTIAGLTGDAVLDGWIFAGDDRAVRDVWSAGRHVVRGGRHIQRERIEARYRSVIADLRGAL